MSATQADLPSTELLTRALAAALADGRQADVDLVRREYLDSVGTHPSEVVTCRRDGVVLRILCKYSSYTHEEDHGHRGGLEREIELYRSVLAADPGTSARFYGFCRTGEPRPVTCLFIDYLAGCVLASRPPGSMLAAARWIGAFHARHAGTSLTTVPAHTRHYYRGWAARTREFSSGRGKQFHWLSEVCARIDDVSDVLLADEATVIHGEYYPKNILSRPPRPSEVFPLDWESAAIASGAIDLASLSESWPPTDIENHRKAYLDARWPEGAPSGFDRTLDAARVYWQVRWLGERPDWTADEKLLWRFDLLRAAAERLGLI